MNYTAYILNADIEYQADSDEEAISKAIDWANERFKEALSTVFYYLCVRNTSSSFMGEEDATIFDDVIAVQPPEPSYGVHSCVKHRWHNDRRNKAQSEYLETCACGLKRVVKEYQVGEEITTFDGDTFKVEPNDNFKSIDYIICEGKEK